MPFQEERQIPVAEQKELSEALAARQHGPQEVLADAQVATAEASLMAPSWRAARDSTRMLLAVARPASAEARRQRPEASHRRPKSVRPVERHPAAPFPADRDANEAAAVARSRRPLAHSPTCSPPLRPHSPPPQPRQHRPSRRPRQCARRTADTPPADLSVRQARQTSGDISDIGRLRP